MAERAVHGPEGEQGAEQGEIGEGGPEGAGLWQGRQAFACGAHEQDCQRAAAHHQPLGGGEAEAVHRLVAHQSGGQAGLEGADERGEQHQRIAGVQAAGGQPGEQPGAEQRDQRGQPQAGGRALAEPGPFHAGCEQQAEADEKGGVTGAGMRHARRFGKENGQQPEAARGSHGHGGAPLGRRQAQPVGREQERGEQKTDGDHAGDRVPVQGAFDHAVAAAPDGGDEQEEQRGRQPCRGEPGKVGEQGGQAVHGSER